MRLLSRFPEGFFWCLIPECTSLRPAAELHIVQYLVCDMQGRYHIFLVWG